LGGQLEIDSDSHGTQILVTLPLGNPTSQTALASD